MSASAGLQTGVWTDHTRGFWNRYQLLTTDIVAQFLTSLVAVAITLVIPNIFILLQSCLKWLASLFKDEDPEGHADPTFNTSSPSRSPRGPSPTRSSRTSTTATERLGLLAAEQYNHTIEANGSTATISAHGADDQASGYGTMSAQVGEHVADIDSLPPREFLWKRVFKPLIRFLRGEVELTKSQIAVMVFVGTLVFGVAAAGTVASIFSARMATATAALSASKHCGIWQFDVKAGKEAARQDNVRTYRKEERAGQYARNCYLGSGPDNSFSCNVFFNQSIAYHRKSGQPCPFSSSSLCVDPFGAATFTTDLVTAATLGINTASPYKFRRKTSCSPVSMSAEYIEQENSTFYYNYGPKNDSDGESSSYTFMTEGDPISWLVPVYSIDPYYYSALYPNNSYWLPIQELMPPENSTITILFVSSHRILHYTPSNDPIFPATDIDPDWNPEWYYNADRRARPVACVDTTELCYGDGSSCWSMRAPLPSEVPDSPAYWFMKWSLENSFTYESIKHRLGTALLAQEKVSDYFSAPLPSDQWENEANQLFATSLARIQWDAWAIALGEGRDLGSYIETTPDEARGHLCHLYKFTRIGYTNLNWLAFWGTLFAAFMIWVLSWNAPRCMRYHKRAAQGTTAESASAQLVAEALSCYVIDVILGLIFGPILLVRNLKSDSRFARKNQDLEVSAGDDSAAATVEPQPGDLQRSNQDAHTPQNGEGPSEATETSESSPDQHNIPLPDLGN